MPNIDPRLATIMAVAVILSTLIVLTIHNAAKPEVITNLRNNYPEVFVKESVQKGIETSFSFAAISGRNLKELELRFAILYEEPPVCSPKDWQPVEGTSLEEVVSHIPIIGAVGSKVTGFGGEFEKVERIMEVNGTRYEVVLYDFSRFLGLFSGDEELSRWTSLFAVLKNEEEVRFFEGRTGFFLEQQNVVEYLMTSHGENRTEYLGKGLEGAPFGILRYTDFGKDEKVSTIFEVLADVEAIPEIPLGKNRLLLQVIQGYADGQLSLFIVNGIPVG